MMIRTSNQRGSIYVLTLLTVAAVGSMVLIGVSVRTATSAESTITEQMNLNNDGVMTAAEHAISIIFNDPDWTTNAQKGVVFSDFTLGNRTYSSTVVDADTLTAPTDSTTNYRVTLTSSHGVAVESAQIDVQSYKVDYETYLDTIGVDAYWPLDELSNTKKVWDTCGKREGEYLDRSAPGTDTNDEGARVPNFFGTAARVETPYDAAYVDDTEGTISFWMKWMGTSTTSTYGIFGQRFQDDSESIPSASLTMTNGMLMMYLDDGAVYDINNYAYTAFKTISSETWHHVAVSWGPNGLRVYVDGTLEGSAPSNTDYWDTLDGKLGQTPLMIAAAPIVSGSYPLTGFDGSIARFAILTSQLDAATIARLAATKPDGSGQSIIVNSWSPVYQD